MHKGNTGAYWVELTLEDDVFVEGDVAIYEVWDGSTRKIHREFELQPAEPTEICPGNGKFLIAFVNSDTDEWEAKSYQTEICMILNPVRADGSVVDGDTVDTLIESTLTIKPVKILI